MKKFLFCSVLAFSLGCVYSAQSNPCRRVHNSLFTLFQQYAQSYEIETTTLCEIWLSTRNVDKMMEAVQESKADLDVSEATQEFYKSLVEKLISQLPLSIDEARLFYQAIRNTMCQRANILHFLIYIDALNNIDASQHSHMSLVHLCNDLSVYSYQELKDQLSLYNLSTDQILENLVDKLRQRGYPELVKSLQKIFVKIDPSYEAEDHVLQVPPSLPDGHRRKKFSLTVKDFVAPDLPPVPRPPLITGYDVPELDGVPGGEGWLGSRRFSAQLKNASWNTPKKVGVRKYQGKWVEDAHSLDYEDEFRPFGPTHPKNKYYRRISEREVALEDKKEKLKAHQKEMKEKKQKMWKHSAGYRDLKGESFGKSDDIIDDLGPSPIEESSVDISSPSSISSDDSSDESDSTEYSEPMGRRYKEPKLKRPSLTISSDVESTEKSQVEEKLPELTKTDAIRGIQKTCRYLTKSQKSRALALYKLLSWLSEGTTNGWDVKPFCHAVYYSEKQLYAKPASELPKHMAKVCVRELRYAQWVFNDPELLKNVPKVCYGFYKRIAEHFRKSKL